ncbi:MAG: DUF1648 domain-containing protein [Armatimonadota bacterium]
MRRLYHPLWTHFFALVALALTGYMLWRFLPQAPERIPMQFSFGGQQIRLGSRWELLGIPVIMLFYLLGSIFIDELWARQEREKRFNWLALIDELLLGGLAGLVWGYIVAYFTKGFGLMVFHLPWASIGAMAGVAVIGAVILELLRPWNPFPHQIETEDASAIHKEIAQRTRLRERWVHWEAQNPAWMSAAIIIASAVMLGSAILSYKLEPFAAAVLAISAVLVVLFLVGGMRTTVTPEKVEVRIGLVGLRVFSQPVSKVTEAKAHDFAPLREFGGYGIRWNGKTTAFYFRGNRGVLLCTTAGKQYLIGSDRPERLAAVIGAAKGKG